MNTNNLYIAEVKDKNDPDENGKVKIFISAIHDIADLNNLPWAMPFNMGNDFNVPEVGERIWVFFEQPGIYQNPFYLTNVTKNNQTITQRYTDIQNQLGNLSGPTASYPNIKFMSSPNGCIIGMSTSDTAKEIFVSHPSGTAFFIDNNGQLFIEAKNVKVITTSQNESALAVNDATYEIACANENYVMTSLGLQPIQPTTDPMRVITKIKN